LSTIWLAPPHCGACSAVPPNGEQRAATISK
jgi:hypothetical protein